MFAQICVLVGDGSLYALIRSSMCAAVLESLMGENILPLSSKVCLAHAAMKRQKTCKEVTVLQLFIYCLLYCDLVNALQMAND